MFELSKEELVVLKKLTTPAKIQDFLDRLPINWEKRGDTLMSPRRVLRERKAHCIEGALLAAAALWAHGEKPLLLDLKAIPSDDDHVLAPYKRNGYWGALSKSNHAMFRFRDPIYKTLRELALSYFHEYLHEKTGKKTLHSYSRPLDLQRFGVTWITAETDLWEIGATLDRIRHYPLVPRGSERLLRKADKLEQRVARIIEWEKSNPRT